MIAGRLRTDVWTPTDGEYAGKEQRRIRIVVDELAISLRYAAARTVQADRAASRSTSSTEPAETAAF